MKGKYPCPRCDTNDWDPVTDVDGPPYDECKKCGYRFTNKDLPEDDRPYTKCEECGFNEPNHYYPDKIRLCRRMNGFVISNAYTNKVYILGCKKGKKKDV